MKFVESAQPLRINLHLSHKLVYVYVQRDMHSHSICGTGITVTTCCVPSGWRARTPCLSRANRAVDLRLGAPRPADAPVATPGEDKDQICVGQCTGSRAATKQLLVDPVRSTGGIFIGHRRSGCPSRGGVLREYRRKALNSGPLNGGPLSKRAKERDGEGTRRSTRILTTVASMQTSRHYE